VRVGHSHPQLQARKRVQALALADLHCPCLVPRSGWVPAGPAPHHACAQPGRREGGQGGRLDTAVLPSQRGDSQAGGRAHATGLQLCLQATLQTQPGGNHLPGARASTQPSQALCLKLPNSILRPCTELSILFKKINKHKKVVVFFCTQAMGGNVFLNRHYKLLNSRPFHQML